MDFNRTAKLEICEAGTYESCLQDFDNTKKWVVFYPVYINSKKTVAEGRQISLSKAGENPICVEIDDCCDHLKLPSVIEIDKAYPRLHAKRESEGITEKERWGLIKSNHFF